MSVRHEVVLDEFMSRFVYPFHIRGFSRNDVSEIYGPIDPTCELE